MAEYIKQAKLYSGKAKTVYTTHDPKLLILHFRDDTSAFDGGKTEQFNKKGEINNKFNAFIMEKLDQAGIPTHFEKLIDPQESLVKNLEMLPIECVVRNIATGSLCRRLGVQDGEDLEPPIFEFFLKNDVLHDPMINEYHIETFGWATKDQVEQMKIYTFQVNDFLKKLFLDAGLLLVDYKLEFGDYQGRLILGDEFTPDGCRLWDIETREKLDKDRFRHGLGGLIEAYEEVAHRIGTPL
ncbi:phosphoribosylaminoimidazolesuccinocarboxamide synthase [Candidatus Nitrosacidococcus sp. I8]|uniref:phosphoribosylaminoimidazolesuccinocarboxamide synthase n=1 Tax=Candidatus Nitrosacidococcus sp. I8 TaxID=2942908 RepID=UPI002225FD54|nr:phosphoribosylaminoimidazolesuccinocarboxamide synthase [Candidatus Nitrosacidococcus sp. I8]CAH9019109.1 Phosphoribosylaminoimidazole-succinocarboxamide synthase [Candidatus Nitrosacidococcus sp. I8]